MSGFDLSVWQSDSQMALAQATEIVQHVGSDWVIFAHEPRFDAFLKELRSRYPDGVAWKKPEFLKWVSVDPFLRSIDDPRPPPPTPDDLRALAAEPRSVWDGEIFQQGRFATMTVSWEHAVEVVPAVKALARKFGLTVLDEDGQLDQPPGLKAGTQPEILRLSLTLHIKGKPPALDATVTEGQAVLVHEVVETRLKAHLVARGLATQRHEIGYHVDDPRCVAQAYTLVPVNLGPSGSGMTISKVQLRPP